MQSSPKNLLAWIGPAISGNCYEVGNEVWDVYVKRYPFSDAAFKDSGDRKLANLAKIADLVLKTKALRQFITPICVHLNKKIPFFPTVEKLKPVEWLL